MPSRGATWLRLGALWLLAAAPRTAAAAPRSDGQRRVYDPEIALLVLNIQKESLPLLASELKRQCEWLGLPGVKVLLDHTADEAIRDVEADLNPDSDILAGFRSVLVRYHPSQSREIDRLIGEVRRYHSLRPGPPLAKLRVGRPAARSAGFIAEAGVGADVEGNLLGTQTIREPLAAAQRRFGSTGPLLTRRRWSIDFYLGDFRDLLPLYWRMGYRVFYRLRAPYISYSKQAYVLAPEGELRPRLVYCGFFGRDYFRHLRAQYDLLEGGAGPGGGLVRTLQCAQCSFTHPGVAAIRELLRTIPYAARNVVMGYPYLFEKPLEARLLGRYENDYWRLSYYDLPAGVTVVVECRSTGFGEISALALEELVHRGAQSLYYAGPASVVAGGAGADRLFVPQEFLDSEGGPVPLRNALPLRRSRSGRHQSVASPLFVTSEWLASARQRGVDTVDCEAGVVAERVAKLNAGRPAPVSLALALVGSELPWLHPDEDRAVYTVGYETGARREDAKRAYRDAVLKLLDRPFDKSETAQP
ncbi:MAG: hypothetical protein NTY77_04510 [Elusimicrobia bacterium]|nr:hypothetical protein [Elusimicrobiota bacterium]